MTQSVKINAYKDKKLLGIFTITSPNSVQIENNESKGDIYLENVPIVHENNTKYPIIYSEINEFANLCFLEETDYKVFFESKKNNIRPFYSLEKFKDKKVIDLYEFKGEFQGSMRFSSYVGKTYLDIYENEECIFQLPIEIRSKKIDYEKHYAQMIGNLSQYASGMIFNLKSPLYQSTDIDDENIFQSPYDLFMIIEHIFLPNNLPAVFEYLSKNLYSSLETYTEETPTSFASDITPDDLIDAFNDCENLYEHGKTWLPLNINETNYKDNIDVNENRFYKYFLETLDTTIEDLCKVIETGYANDKLKKYKKEVEYYLSHRYFSDISRIEYIPFNSQVLQKKEGYRDILSFYLMLEFGIKLKWNDLTSEFKGNEKKVYKLYEYWCYFKLIDIIKRATSLEIDFEDIFEISRDTHTISLKENLEKSSENEEIKISLLYNKTFGGCENSKFNEYHTYSVDLRPDYTVVIHNNTKNYFIHFDAKYRFNDKKERFEDDDIAKMHEYKDAIKNTIGAYVLYPGNENKLFYKDEYKLESVGAFGLIPDEERLDHIIPVIQESIKQVYN